MRWSPWTAYQYFGTDELYLDHLSRFVRPNGSLGVVVVGLMREMGAEAPAHLTKAQSNGKVFWESSCRSFKTEDFWRALWSSSPMVTDVAAATQPDGWRHWRDFERALEAAGKNSGIVLALARIAARQTFGRKKG